MDKKFLLVTEVIFMLTLVSEHRIYGCHKLKNQGGKCTQWHGHQYKVILTLKAPYKLRRSYHGGNEQVLL